MSGIHTFPPLQEVYEAIFQTYLSGNKTAFQYLESLLSKFSWKLVVELLTSIIPLVSSPNTSSYQPTQIGFLQHHTCSIVLDKVQNEWASLDANHQGTITSLLNQFLEIKIHNLQNAASPSSTKSNTLNPQDTIVLTKLCQSLATIAVIDGTTTVSQFLHQAIMLATSCPLVSLELLHAVVVLKPKIHLSVQARHAIQDVLVNYSDLVLLLCNRLLAPLSTVLLSISNPHGNPFLVNCTPQDPLSTLRAYYTGIVPISALFYPLSTVPSYCSQLSSDLSAFISPSVLRAVYRVASEWIATASSLKTLLGAPMSAANLNVDPAMLTPQLLSFLEIPASLSLEEFPAAVSGPASCGLILHTSLSLLSFDSYASMASDFITACLSVNEYPAATNMPLYLRLITRALVCAGSRSFQRMVSALSCAAAQALDKSVSFDMSEESVAAYYDIRKAEASLRSVILIARSLASHESIFLASSAHEACSLTNIMLAVLSLPQRTRLVSLGLEYITRILEVPVTQRHPNLQFSFYKASQNAKAANPSQSDSVCALSDMAMVLTLQLGTLGLSFRLLLEAESLGISPTTPASVVMFGYCAKTKLFTSQTAESFTADPTPVLLSIFGSDLTPQKITASQGMLSYFKQPAFQGDKLATLLMEFRSDEDFTDSHETSLFFSEIEEVLSDTFNGLQLDLIVPLAIAIGLDLDLVAKLTTVPEISLVYRPSLSVAVLTNMLQNSEPNTRFSIQTAALRCLVAISGAVEEWAVFGDGCDGDGNAMDTEWLVYTLNPRPQPNMRHPGQSHANASSLRQGISPMRIASRHAILRLLGTMMVTILTTSGDLRLLLNSSTHVHNHMDSRDTQSIVSIEMTSATVASTLQTIRAVAAYAWYGNLTAKQGLVYDSFRQFSQPTNGQIENQPTSVNPSCPSSWVQIPLLSTEFLLSVLASCFFLSPETQARAGCEVISEIHSTCLPAHSIPCLFTAQNLKHPVGGVRRSSTRILEEANLLPVHPAAAALRAVCVSCSDFLTIPNGFGFDLASASTIENSKGFRDLSVFFTLFLRFSLAPHSLAPMSLDPMRRNVTRQYLTPKYLSSYDNNLAYSLSQILGGINYIPYLPVATASAITSSLAMILSKLSSLVTPHLIVRFYHQYLSLLKSLLTSQSEAWIPQYVEAATYALNADTNVTIHSARRMLMNSLGLSAEQVCSQAGDMSLKLCMLITPLTSFIFWPTPNKLCLTDAENGTTFARPTLDLLSSLAPILGQVLTFTKYLSLLVNSAATTPWSTIDLTTLSDLSSLPRSFSQQPTAECPDPTSLSSHAELCVRFLAVGASASPFSISSAGMTDSSTSSSSLRASHVEIPSVLQLFPTIEELSSTQEATRPSSNASPCSTVSTSICYYLAKTLEITEEHSASVAPSILNLLKSTFLGSPPAPIINHEPLLRLPANPSVTETMDAITASFTPEGVNDKSNPLTAFTPTLEEGPLRAAIPAFQTFAASLSPSIHEVFASFLTDTTLHIVKTLIGNGNLSPASASRCVTLLTLDHIEPLSAYFSLVANSARLRVKFAASTAPIQTSIPPFGVHWGIVSGFLPMFLWLSSNVLSATSGDISESNISILRDLLDSLVVLFETWSDCENWLYSFDASSSTHEAALFHKSIYQSIAEVDVPYIQLDTNNPTTGRLWRVVPSPNLQVIPPLSTFATYLLPPTSILSSTPLLASVERLVVELFKAIASPEGLSQSNIQVSRASRLLLFICKSMSQTHSAALIRMALEQCVVSPRPIDQRVQIADCFLQALFSMIHAETQTKSMTPRKSNIGTSHNYTSSDMSLQRAAAATERKFKLLIFDVCVALQSSTSSLDQLRDHI